MRSARRQTAIPRGALGSTTRHRPRLDVAPSRADRPVHRPSCSPAPRRTPDSLTISRNFTTRTMTMTTNAKDFAAINGLYDPLEQAGPNPGLLRRIANSLGGRTRAYFEARTLRSTV